MQSRHSLIKSLKLLLIGLLGSAFFSIAALTLQPRLLLLVAIAGPAFAGLFFPPHGRRVFRELAIAVLMSTTVISIMRFMPTSA